MWYVLLVHIPTNEQYFLVTQWLVYHFQGFEHIFTSAFLLMSTLYHGMGKKLKTAEDKIKELTALLQKRNEAVQKLATTVNELSEVTDENERRLEMQQHELKELRAILREMFIAQEMKRGASFSNVCNVYFGTGARAGEMSQEFWVLRKNRRNLCIITQPHIQQIIRAALEACLVSENIGKCATKCPTPGHDCTEGFYKALQVKVGEAPHTLKVFLLLIQEKIKDSESLQLLCSRMLAEIHI
jgi:hypothetical protein